jgi:hypothetical protein
MMSSAHINNSKRKLASLSIFIAGFLSSPTNTHAQYNIQDLDDALLNDFSIPTRIMSLQHVLVLQTPLHSALIIQA